MRPVKSFPFIFCLVVLCVRTQGADAPSTSDKSSLEAAKRSLQESSAVLQARRQQDGTLAPASGAVPDIGDAKASAPAAPQPTSEAPVSATWLQDSVDQIRREQTAQKASIRDARLSTRAGTKAEADPLSPFMDQWLSPHDRELLRPEGSEPDGTAPQRLGIAPTATGQTMVRDNRPQADPSRALFAPANNPYLEETEAPLPPSAPTQAISPLPSPAPVSQPPPPAAEPPKPEAKRPQERPATAPLIDDRKYFPQLRRF